MSNTRQQTMESRIDALEKGLKIMDARLSGELASIKDSMASIRDLLAGLMAEKNKSNADSDSGSPPNQNPNLEDSESVDGPRKSGADTAAGSTNLASSTPPQKSGSTPQLPTLSSSKVDGTYTHNMENFADKVCMLAHKAGDENEKRGLRASSLRCLSAMVWFMAEFSHIFTDFEKIVHATLGNYETDSQSEEDERNEAHHNWVDEVARSEGRGTLVGGGEFSPSHMIIRIRPEKKDPALLDKLRLEKCGTNKVEEERKHGRSHKNSPNVHIISSIMDMANGTASLIETEQYFLQCNEDQVVQLLSALWIQVNRADNLPSNIEAIAYSFCLALISSRLKNSNDNLVLRFFQLPILIKKMTLDQSNVSLPPVYQRSLLVLSTAMVMFATKLYHVADTNNLLNLLLGSDVDPYLGITDDFQVYVKAQHEAKVYGSPSDNEETFATLSELCDKAYESDKAVFDILVDSLSTITKFETEEISKQLSEGFVPHEAFMFGSQSMLDMDHIQRAAHSKGSLSFDGEFSANSLVEDDAMSYYGPFKVEERIGTVAYRLRLLEGCRWHPVFHVSLLKAAIDQHALEDKLPEELWTVDPEFYPEWVLRDRWVWRGDDRVREVLVQWRDKHEDDATWVTVEDLLSQFPHFSFEDKAVWKDGGVVRDRIYRRRSKRVEEGRGSKNGEERGLENSKNVHGAYMKLTEERDVHGKE